MSKLKVQITMITYSLSVHTFTDRMIGKRMSTQHIYYQKIIVRLEYDLELSLIKTTQ